MPLSPRHWQIRSASHAADRPWPLITAELEALRTALLQVVEDFDQRSRRFVAAPGEFAVLDTNVLLHFLPPDQVDWRSVVKADELRLVIPLRVVEELDAKKYARRDDLADRARRILRQIEELVGPGGMPGSVSASVTLEVLIQSGPRFRPDDADEELLLDALELQELSGRRVTLITGDTSLRLRAGALGLPVAAPPDAYRRKTVTASTGT